MEENLEAALYLHTEGSPFGTIKGKHTESGAQYVHLRDTGCTGTKKRNAENGLSRYSLIFTGQGSQLMVKAAKKKFQISSLSYSRKEKRIQNRDFPSLVTHKYGNSSKEFYTQYVQTFPPMLDAVNFDYRCFHLTFLSPKSPMRPFEKRF